MKPSNFVAIYATGFLLLGLIAPAIPTSHAAMSVNFAAYAGLIGGLFFGILALILAHGERT
jgi:hypothetical protein